MADELGCVSWWRGGHRFREARRLARGRRREEGDAVGKRHGFFLVVGDEEKRDAEFALEGFQFALHLLAEVGVEGGERLVEEKKLRAIDERASESDALLLAAAESEGGQRRTPAF